MSEIEIWVPAAGVAFAASASLVGVLATQRAAHAATVRAAAVNEFRAQVAARDTWIAELDKRLDRLEQSLASERDYVDRLRDWIAGVALPALAQAHATYPPVPEYRAFNNPRAT